MRARVGLIAILLLGAGLRVSGISWGVPRYDADLAAGTPLRSSYHLDEDKVLWPLATGQNVRSYWGVLTPHLTAAALAVGEWTGLVRGGWRRAFRDATPSLPIVFVIGRLLSVAFGLLAIAVAWAWARDRAGDTAGLLAGGLLAVSPLHVVHCHFLTPDAALAFWIAVGLWRLERGSALGGLALGLALATKPSAAFAVPALASLDRRRAALAFLAILGGFLAADPSVLLQWREAAASLGGLARDTGTTTFSAAGRMWAFQAWQVTFYGLGPVALVCAVLRLRQAPRATLLAVVSLFLSLGLSRIPVARYALPLLPVLAVEAGIALGALRPRRRATLAGMALVPPLLLSVGQVGLMRDVHTAQRTADWMVAHSAPGTSVAQLWPEYPVLDGRRFTLHPLQTSSDTRPRVPLSADLVVLDDLQIERFPAETQAALAHDYRPEVVFTRPPRLGPFVLPEPWAAHDWKYTHPALKVLRRNAPAP